MAFDWIFCNDFISLSYRIQCSLGIFAQADGSAYLEQGNTKVLAAVYGPHEVSTCLF